MTVKDVIGQVEAVFGRQPEKYMVRLINDGLNDISSQKQHYTVSTLHDLKVKQRWYDLSAQVIDIIKVEVKDTDGRYVKVPKLVDPHNLLKDDTDASDDSLV